jgi:hypothetical protein
MQNYRSANQPPTVQNDDEVANYNKFQATDKNNSPFSPFTNSNLTTLTSNEPTVTNSLFRLSTTSFTMNKGAVTTGDVNSLVRKNGKDSTNQLAQQPKSPKQIELMAFASFTPSKNYFPIDPEYSDAMYKATKNTRNSDKKIIANALIR